MDPKGEIGRAYGAKVTPHMYVIDAKGTLVYAGAIDDKRSANPADIKTSTLQSRALAGVANGTYVFCVPGSSGACATAWDSLIAAQLDARTRPCNLVELMPRLQEK